MSFTARMSRGWSALDENGPHTSRGGETMAIQLDHMIVPSRNRVQGARRLASLLGAPWAESQGNFTPVYVNETLTLDFAEREQFEGHHACFRVSEGEFAAILARIEAAGIPYRSSPRGANDMQINRRLGGKNLYWEDADGHLWEILTVSYARPEVGASTAAGQPLR
jgi:catechol 2,3-dioxygenase-like lactoylglutathione lyase family enzyme